MTKHIYCDVVIAGCGAAGLYTALNLPKDLHVLMICKEDMDTCDSMLAQGGICVLRGEDDYESYFEDTMRAGHYENRKESVDLMIRTSPGIIRHLLELGVGFDKNPDGSLKYTKEGAHSRPRICFHEDITGKAITTVLQEQTAALPNVNIMEYTVMTDILTANGACAGILARTGDGSTLSIHARDTVMATGGIGGLYQHSTNFPCLTGDALTVARKHGVKLEHLDYVQIHPTSLYTEKPGRSFLISESARGEGAVLLNGKGERFVNELLPRDAVSQAIEAEMEKREAGMFGCPLRPCPVKPYGNIFHIYMKPALRKVMTSQGSPSRWCLPSIILWAACGWTWIPEPPWSICTQWVKPAATGFTERTAWPATACWRAWCLPGKPQKNREQPEREN